MITWASLVAQTVKNPPAMPETWIWSLGWEDNAEEGNGYPLLSSCLENPMDRGAWQPTKHGVAESDMTEPLTWSLNYSNDIQTWQIIWVHWHFFLPCDPSFTQAHKVVIPTCLQLNYFLNLLGKQNSVLVASSLVSLEVGKVRKPGSNWEDYFIESGKKDKDLFIFYLKNSNASLWIA